MPWIQMSRTLVPLDTYRPVHYNHVISHVTITSHVIQCDAVRDASSVSTPTIRAYCPCGSITIAS